LAGGAAHAQALRRQRTRGKRRSTDELALAGDDDGAATWRRIMAAVAEFANKTPPGRVY
jgi:hypothetical protein